MLSTPRQRPVRLRCQAWAALPALAIAAALSLMWIINALSPQQTLAPSITVTDAPAPPVTKVAATTPPVAAPVDLRGKFTGKTHDGKTKLASLSPDALKAKLMDVLKLVQTSPAEFRIGEVQIDATTRTITFPAMLEMTSGQLEYALVHETGKVHETLFKTDVPPQDIHIAALLMSGPGMHPDVEVVWQTNGPPARRKLTEMIRVSGPEPEMLREASWNYTGSQFEPAGFAAQTEGSCISLIADAQALISPALEPQKLGDELFTPQTAQLPPKGARVQFVLHFPPAAR